MWVCVGILIEFEIPLFPVIIVHTQKKITARSRPDNREIRIKGGRIREVELYVVAWYDQCIAFVCILFLSVRGIKPISLFWSWVCSSKVDVKLWGDLDYLHACTRDVRVQMLTWFQTFLLFTKPHFQTLNAVWMHWKAHLFKHFILFQTFSHRCSHIPEALKLCAKQ